MISTMILLSRNLKHIKIIKFTFHQSFQLKFQMSVSQRVGLIAHDDMMGMILMKHKLSK